MRFSHRSKQSIYFENKHSFSAKYSKRIDGAFCKCFCERQIFFFAVALEAELGSEQERIFHAAIVEEEEEQPELPLRPLLRAEQRRREGAPQHRGTAVLQHGGSFVAFSVHIPYATRDLP